MLKGGLHGEGGACVAKGVCMAVRGACVVNVW